MQVTYKQAKRMIIAYMKAGLVPMIEGSPGIGKSSIVHQIAKEFNLLVIDLRLSQCDPTDLLGFPQINGNKAGYAPMATFPLEGDELPINPETGKPYDGWILLLDELSSANRAVQAASYKLTLDRMVGQWKIHPRCKIICAGNKETDGAIVEPMSTALQSRLVHMELVLDVNEWLDYSFDAGMDHRIGDYIKFKNSSLYTFKPDHTDKTYACPRTWEFASRLLQQIPDVKHMDAKPLLAGTLSEGVAREFLNFLKIYKTLPKVEDIIASPRTIAVPEEPSVIWALTGTLANQAQEDTVVPIMTYVKRLAKEYQVITLKEMIRRNRALKKVPTIAAWVADNEDLF